MSDNVPVFGAGDADSRLWVRAATAIKARLDDGRYPDGKWLPTTGEIGLEIGISGSPVLHALTELCSKELLTRVPRLGYYAGNGMTPAGWPPRSAWRRAPKTAPDQQPPPPLPAILARQYMTTADLAAILRVPREFVCQLIRQGCLEGAIQIGEKAYRIPVDSAEAYVKDCLVALEAGPR